MCGLQVLPGTHSNKNGGGATRGQHYFDCRAVRWWYVELHPYVGLKKGVASGRLFFWMGKGVPHWTETPAA